MDRSLLLADCSVCTGLCCVAPAYSRGADFPLDKPAGTPCRNLLTDARCGVHDRLRPLGFAGCVVFDCFGAGQQVVQITHAEDDWRESAATAARVFGSFGALRQLHELRWHLTEAHERVTGALQQEVGRVLRTAQVLSAAGPDELARTDVVGLRDDVGELLSRVSAQVRSGLAGADHRGADLVGADLRRAPLRGATLRGALLLGADLRGAVLDRADLLGADLRGADVRGTDLRASLFLTVPQLRAARGDATTRPPNGMDRPAHWSHG